MIGDVLELYLMLRMEEMLLALLLQLIFAAVESGRGWGNQRPQRGVVVQAVELQHQEISGFKRLFFTQ